MRAVAVTAFACAGLLALPCPAPAQELVFRGVCDGSGAILLPDGSIATVDDEKAPRLLIYGLRGGTPAAVVSIPGISDSNLEPDLEAGTRAGGMSLWIGSHSRNSRGGYRRERQVLLGIPVDTVAAHSIPAAAVHRVASLRTALIAWGQDEGVAMAEAFGPEDQTVPDLAAERRGVNIEAMAYDPRSGTLLIGFRNPVPGGQALIAPLTNLDAVLRGEGARFGPPIRLPLGERGLRDMVWSERHQSLLLIAGPSGDDGTFALYRWSGGQPAEVPWSTPLPGGFHPETVLALPGTDDVLVLSDDGDVIASDQPEDCKREDSGVRIAPCTCKDIRDDRADQRRLFRGVRMPVR